MASSFIDQIRAAFNTGAAIGTKLKGEPKVELKGEIVKPKGDTEVKEPSTTTVAPQDASIRYVEPNKNAESFTVYEEPLSFEQAELARPYQDMFNNFVEVYSNEPDHSKRKLLLNYYGNYTPLGKTPLAGKLLRNLMDGEVSMDDGNDKYDHGYAAGIVKDIFNSELGKFGPYKM